MKKYIFFSVFVIVLLFQSSSLFAQKAKGAASYLRLGSGARAIGLGKAYTSIVDDASATFWNPACLIRINKFNLIINNRLGEDSNFGTNFFSIAAAYSLSKKYGTIGVSLFNYSVDDIYRFNEYAVYLGNFNLVERACFLSYGIGTELFSLGASVKYIEIKFQNLGVNNKNGVGFDLSFLYTILSNLKIGLIYRDNVNIGQYDEMEESVQFGAHYSFNSEFFDFPQKSILALDVEQLKTKPFRFHIGFETFLDYFNKISFAFRTGISNYYLESRTSKVDYSILNENSRKFTIGLGVILEKYLKGKVSIDYAFILEKFDSTSFLTFTYGI